LGHFCITATAGDMRNSINCTFTTIYIDIINSRTGDVKGKRKIKSIGIDANELTAEDAEVRRGLRERQPWGMLRALNGLSLRTFASYLCVLCG
jgi:hypothetical protein